MKTKTAFKTTDMVYIALGAVLIAICSWISIPTVVPFTMQTFAVCFLLYAFGGRRGTIAIILYILLGAIGVPVFSHFTSGPGVLLGNTGGYILGFIFMGLIYSLTIRLLGKKMWTDILGMILGLAACYFFGTVWFILIYTRNNGAISIVTALSWCVIPFIIPDLLKLALALLLSKRLTPVLRLQ